MNHDSVYYSANLSRRNVLKTILFTPPLMLFSKGGLFAAQEIEPVFAPRIIPAGQKVRAAQIGVFNRGNEVLGSFRSFSDKQIKYVAFADVAFPSQGASVNGFAGVPCFQDYRQMLEEMHEQIDAVIIATPDHAHFPMVMHSMLLGKHVYVEKPMAQNVYECRLLEKTARACKVVTQMGNQGHSGAGTIQFGQWVEAGLVKNVKKVDAWMTNSRRWHGWSDTEYPESIPPIGFDWDLWLCRRPFRPHSEKLTGGNWRCWYEFGCGAMGDWGAHILDAVHHYLKLGQPYEISTTLKGPSDLLYPQGSVITFKFKGRDGMPPLEVNWYDGQKNNPTPPAGVTGDIGNVGSFIYTEDYVIRGTSHGGDYKILPNEKMLDLQKAGKLPKPKGELPNHYQNFLNACQGLEAANSRFEISAPLAEMLCLGCIGQRFGGTLLYDAEAMKITNHAEADAMLKGPQVRTGWEAYDERKPVKSKAAQIKKPEDVEWDNLVDSTLSRWENPYEWGKAEVVNKEVHLTTDKDKWFLLTKKEYANFIFEGEIKMPVKEGNSGFMFRCQKGKNRAWGYQAEVDTADRKWSGGIYDEGRRLWFASPNKDKAADEAQKNASIEAFRARAGECYKQGEWNLYRIVCIGPHIQIYVNGTLTTDIYDEMDTAGYLGIQHHGEKGLVYQFRNLRVKDLGAGGEVYYPHRETAKAAAVASKMAGAIYEAEAANKLSADAKPADNHGGFQGTGFIDMGGAGSFVEWNNVLADKGGQYKLTFRYAAAGDRPCELFVNGASAGKLAFANTGNWTDWKTVDAEVTFKNGGNIVRITALGDGPNIDAMAVNPVQ